MAIPVFILKGGEDDPFGGAGALPRQHQPAHFEAASVGGVGERPRGDGAARRESAAQQRDRVRLQRQPQAGVILGDFLARRGGGKDDLGFARLGGGEQRRRRRARPRGAPQPLAAGEAERAEGVGARQPVENVVRQAGARAQRLEAPVSVAARRLQPPRGGFVEALDLPQAEAQGEAAGASSVGLQGAVPIAAIDVGRAHRNPVLPRVAHDLRRGVEAHGLAVEQRRGESGGDGGA